MDERAPSPIPASPTGGSVAADRRVSDLDKLRRYTYWSVVATTVGLITIFAITGPVPRPPAPIGTASWVSLLILIPAVLRLTGHHIPPAREAGPLSDVEWRFWAVTGGAASVVMASASVAAGDDVMWIVSPAVVASLLLPSVPARNRRLAIALSVGLAAVVGIALTLVPGTDPLLAVPLGGAILTAFLLFAILTSIWMWNLVLQLDDARRQAATLAVTNERLRFAADLHDIQGHHLQVIALKSELAARLVATQPEAAEREMSEVQQLAVDAQRDTRAVVQGYRRTTLAAEIGNATTVLGSAGVDARFHLDPGFDTDSLPETSRHLLGLVVREAITNILRHSAATHAEVTLTGSDPIRLRIVNDGVTSHLGDDGASTDTGGATAGDGAPSSGGGLRGLAERLAGAGGELTWERGDDRFGIVAELPYEVVGSATPGTEPVEPADAPGAPGAPHPQPRARR